MISSTRVIAIIDVVAGVLFFAAALNMLWGTLHHDFSNQLVGFGATISFVALGVLFIWHGVRTLRFEQSKVGS